MTMGRCLSVWGVGVLRQYLGGRLYFLCVFNFEIEAVSNSSTLTFVLMTVLNMDILLDDDLKKWMEKLVDFSDWNNE